MGKKREKKMDIAGAAQKIGGALRPAQQFAGDMMEKANDLKKSAGEMAENLAGNVAAAWDAKKREKLLTMEFLEQLETLTPPERAYIVLEGRKPRKDSSEDNYIGEYNTILGIRINRLEASPEVLEKLDFPKGHRVALQKVYIAHPLKIGTYLPYDQYFELLEAEQRKEIEGALLALGAQVYTFEYREYSEEQVQGGVQAKLGLNLLGQKAKMTGGEMASSETTQSYQVLDRMKMDFEPRQPKRPQLLWLEDDPKWVELIDRCLNGGGGRTWEYTFECSKTTAFSLEDAKQLDAAMAKLPGKLMVKGGFSAAYSKQQRKAFHFNVIF